MQRGILFFDTGLAGNCQPQRTHEATMSDKTPRELPYQHRPEWTATTYHGEEIVLIWIAEDGTERRLTRLTPALATLVDADDYDACAQQASYAGALE